MTIEELKKHADTYKKSEFHDDASNHYLSEHVLADAMCRYLDDSPITAEAMDADDSWSFLSDAKLVEKWVHDRFEITIHEGAISTMGQLRAATELMQ